MYDFIVIGASFAGCSFALNISSSASVLLLDKRDIFSNNLKNCKPCGGLISPDAQKELFKQNISIDHSFLEDPQLISILNYDFDNNKEIYFSRFYFNIDRQKFNQNLVKRVLERKNCELKKEKVLSYEKLTEGFIVKTKNGEFKTKKIIIAQGWNNHLVENRLKKKQYATKYIVLQEWFENTNKQINTHSVVFDKSITDHYAWVVPKGDKFLLGVGINRKENRDYKELFYKLKENLTQRGMDLSKPLHLESCMVMRPKQTSDVYMGNNDVIIIGEAAHLISSSSSEGYSYALKSGRLVAEALNKNDLNLKKIEAYFKRNIRKKIIKMHIISKPFLRKLIYMTKLFQI